MTKRVRWQRREDLELESQQEELQLKDGPLEKRPRLANTNTDTHQQGGILGRLWSGVSRIFSYGMKKLGLSSAQDGEQDTRGGMVGRRGGRRRRRAGGERESSTSHNRPSSLSSELPTTSSSSSSSSSSPPPSPPSPPPPSTAPASLPSFLPSLWNEGPSASLPGATTVSIDRDVPHALPLENHHGDGDDPYIIQGSVLLGGPPPGGSRRVNNSRRRRTPVLYQMQKEKHGLFSPNHPFSPSSSPSFPSSSPSSPSPPLESIGPLSPSGSVASSPVGGHHSCIRDPLLGLMCRGGRDGGGGGEKNFYPRNNYTITSTLSHPHYSHSHRPPTHHHTPHHHHMATATTTLHGHHGNQRWKQLTHTHPMSVAVSSVSTKKKHTPPPPQTAPSHVERSPSSPTPPPPPPPPPPSLPTLRSREVQRSREWLEGVKERFERDSRERRARARAAERKAREMRKEREEVEEGMVERLRRELGLVELEEEEEEAEISNVLTDAQRHKVEVATRQISGGQVLVQRFNLEITGADLRTLVGLEWLNDNVINFYLNMIAERTNSEGKTKIHAFSSFFYPSLQRGYPSVRRWTRKIDLLSCNLVLVPVHLGMHWCLAVIDFDQKQFSYYDSLMSYNRKCIQLLRDYLVCEAWDKKKLQYDLSHWKDCFPTDIPTQHNSSDCGVFSCMFARHIARDAPLNFSQKDMPWMRKHMICEILEKKLF